MNKQRLNKSRLFLAMFLIVGTIAGTDAVRRNYAVITDDYITVDGSFRDPDTPRPEHSADSLNLSVTGTQDPTVATADLKNLGYTELDIPSSELSGGLLAIAGETPSEGANDAHSELVRLGDVKNDYYLLSSDDLMLASEAADALNSLMEAYNKATGLSDFIIYTTTEGYTAEDSLCPESFPESSTGFTIDLAVNGLNRALPYDGMDEEAWITENCADYGYIVRYPAGKEECYGRNSCVWHLRYVGKVHAGIMKSSGLCLEEYIEWIKKYTYDSLPYECESGGVKYEIYYAPSMGDTTSVRVPVSGNYSVSGNGKDGYIISAVKPD